ncbi:hypothetical protein MLD38_022197 [Melastoma candidum]|uniref:Uncharacterized protein n=1 Tax=Melastoma candidum TaxID=119954 RepID=A0ACB9QRL6_9MYRT|nr:hypothetical protein MLD38_022197 [Melastoma candidum]
MLPLIIKLSSRLLEKAGLPGDLGGSDESCVEVSPGAHTNSAGYHSKAITPGFDCTATPNFSVHKFFEPINQVDSLCQNEEAKEELILLKNSRQSTLDAGDGIFETSQPLQIKRDSCSFVERDELLCEENEVYVESGDQLSMWDLKKSAIPS